MPRGRRYRTFLIFAVIFSLAFVHFIRLRKSSTGWTEPTTTKSKGAPPAAVPPDSFSLHNNGAATEAKSGSKDRIDVPAASKPKDWESKQPSPPQTAPQKEQLDGVQSKPELIEKPPSRPAVDELEPIGTPVAQAPSLKDSHGDNTIDQKPKYPIYHEELNDYPTLSHFPKPAKHWKKLPEHFPILQSELIPLPSGKPKSLPKLQAVFKDESVAQSTFRKQRLSTVREEFEHAWNGYTKYALGHDEVRPVSGTHRDPFAGWGATLVDALDTLWIMDMKDEFENAVNEVAKIDFTTSSRNDIPLFETVIRYLGGLVGAYDISGQKYKSLLDKAVELAEILIGAFDTPNRMPVTYYRWSPENVAQPHRAGTGVVLAELGSLSVEFTRLAQLTQEHKYYDAVARITNELEIMQNNTKLPGMWPLRLDASGCKPGRVAKPSDNAIPISYEGTIYKEDRGLAIPARAPTPTLASSKPALASMPTPSPKKLLKDDTIPKEMEKRDGGLALDAEPADYGTIAKPTPVAKSPLLPNFECEKQGLASHSLSDEFGLGGQSDSTYEYLPKEYMLLGGLEDQYRDMYKFSMETVREKLLFRPMIPDNKRDIRFVSTARVSKITNKYEEEEEEEEAEYSIRYTYEGTHLTCFAGGMFAVGAKLFGIEDDMDIAAKLTNGCVWAYESTNTGIMPEGFELLACEDPVECSWNETRYLDVMDPYETTRIEQAEAAYERELKDAKQAQAVKLEKQPTIVAPTRISGSEEREPWSQPDTYAGVAKRDASNSGVVDDYDEHAHLSTTKPSVGSPQIADTSNAGVVDDYDEHAHLSTTNPSVEGPQNAKSHSSPKVQSNGLPAKPKILSHKEFVSNKLETEHIPMGYTRLQSRKYILRPEAIESVFIMYRMTGDETWREKGWKMFQSIARYCRTELADSAISDVTSPAPELLDEMESFWLAETLKYFYLLFSDPDVVSLDEYVLNTEAHPFKRPLS